MIAQQDNAEQGRLDWLGLGEGGRDGEVLVREKMDQHARRKDLREAAGHAAQDEGEVQGRSLGARTQQEAAKQRQRQGRSIDKACCRRAPCRERGAQLLLQRGPHVLQERGGNGYGDPDFHPALGQQPDDFVKARQRG